MIDFQVELPRNAGFRKTYLPGVVDQSETAIQGLRMPRIIDIITSKLPKQPVDKLAKQQVAFHRFISSLDQNQLPKVALEPRALHEFQDMTEGDFIPLEILTKQGLDPKLILVYRITSPRDVEKPERMWTTDPDTFLQMYEIDPNGKVVLVSSLEEVANTGGGVIIDHMDTNGISIRQVEEVNFPETHIWGTVPFIDLF